MSYRCPKQRYYKTRTEKYIATLKFILMSASINLAIQRLYDKWREENTHKWNKQFAFFGSFSDNYFSISGFGVFNLHHFAANLTKCLLQVARLCFFIWLKTKMCRSRAVVFGFETKSLTVNVNSRSLKCSQILEVKPSSQICWWKVKPWDKQLLLFNHRRKHRQ